MPRGFGLGCMLGGGLEMYGARLLHNVHFVNCFAFGLGCC